MYSPSLHQMEVVTWVLNSRLGILIFLVVLLVWEGFSYSLLQIKVIQEQIVSASVHTSVIHTNRKVWAR